MTSLRKSLPGLISGRRALFDGILAATEPLEELTVSEWADRYRIISAESGSPFPGKWLTDRMPHLREPMDCLHPDHPAASVTMKCSAQVGKALDLDTPLPTPTGWTTMGEVRPGDLLLAETGHPCRVTAISPIQQGRLCYRVQFGDGSEIIADAEHRWYVEPSAGDRSRRAGVMTTAQLLADLHTLRPDGRCRNNWAVPVAHALELPEADLPIPPYVLGLWLGDGNTVSAQISVGDQDIDAISALLAAEGVVVDAKRERTAWRLILDPLDADGSHCRGYATAADYSRAMYRHRRYGEPIQPTAAERRTTMHARLKALGLIGSKRVPAQYLRGSFAQRLALLQGLMDADGHIQVNGVCEFSSTDAALAQAVHELAASLGLKPRIASSVAKLYGTEVSPKFRVSFVAYAETPVFRLARKAGRQRSARDPKARPTETRRRFIASIEPVESRPVKCVAVDSPSHLYLAGRSMIPTHNTELIVNWFGFIVDRAPGPMMVILPSLDEATKFNRIKLQPSIDASPKIRHRVAAENARDEAASTTSFKRFAGGFAQIVTASSSKGLQMVSIRYMARDEISEYPFDTDGRGDPIDQSEKRLKAYTDLGLAKRLDCSTPGLAGMCRITERYEAGDRRRRYVPCPHCGDFQVLVHDNMVEPSESTKGRAGFKCISCGCFIDQVDRREMLAQARWIPTRVAEGEPTVPDVIPADAIAGFECPPCEGRCRDWQPSYEIWAAYSPLENWTQIWARGEEAKGNPIKMKAFVQQDKGQPYEAESDAPDWQKLHGKREDYPARVVPYPAAVLSGFIDVQRDRLEWAVWAWGPRAEGWIIDRGVIPYPPEVDEAWAQVDALLAKSYPTAGGAEIPVDLFGIDTGDNTTELYLRVRGRSHRLVACKGANRPNAIPITAKPVEVKDKHGRRIGKLVLNWIGNFGLKSRIYQGLANLVAGADAAGRFKPETLHLCRDLIDEDQCKQLTSEILVDPAEEAKGKARRSLLQRSQTQKQWMKKVGARNEALDIVVGARALAFALGVDSFSPERWAQVWRDRSVVPPDPDLFGREAPADESDGTVAGPAVPTPRLFGLAKPPGEGGAKKSKSGRRVTRSSFLSS